MNEERYAHYNYPGTLNSARQNFRITNIKLIIQNLLMYSFSATNTELQMRNFEIKKFQILDKEVFETKPRDRDPIFIYREFPFKDRKYPMLLVRINGPVNEIKNYLGWDNIAYANILNDQGIKLGEVVEGQMHECKIDIGVAAQSIDDRDYLCTAIQNLFQDYYRSNYIWEHPDQRHYYQINIGHTSIEVNLDSSPVTDTAGKEQFPIYTGTVIIPITVEQQYRKLSAKYIFSDNLVISPTMPNLDN